MNALEQQIKAWLESRGFTVIQNGWPDFFCYQDNVNFQGRIESRFMAVEVKSNVDKIKEHQAHVHNALRAAGVPTYVIRPKDFDSAVKTQCKIAFSPSSMKGMKNHLKEIDDRIAQLQTEQERIRRAMDNVLIAFDEYPPSPKVIKPGLLQPEGISVSVSALA